MPAIDRSLSDFILNMMISPDKSWGKLTGAELSAAKALGYVADPVCFAYTCRRLIDLSLIAGIR